VNSRRRTHRTDYPKRIVLLKGTEGSFFSYLILLPSVTSHQSPSHHVTSFFSRSCALFCTLQIHNGFPFHHFRTLYPNHRGVVCARAYLLNLGPKWNCKPRQSSANSVRPALPGKSSSACLALHATDGVPGHESIPDSLSAAQKKLRAAVVWDEGRPPVGGKQLPCG
jgi:hypothetical protein